MYTLWSELRSNSLVLSDCQYGCNVWSVPIIPSTFIPCRAITVKNMCIRFEVHAHYVYTRELVVLYFVQAPYVRNKVDRKKW